MNTIELLNIFSHKIMMFLALFSFSKSRRTKNCSLFPVYAHT